MSDEIIWYRMCDPDREEYGGDEWSPIDIGRLMDTKSQTLERWERESGGIKVERALIEVMSPGRVTPASACTRMMLWIGRKQNGDATLKTDDGRPESWDAFNPRTLRVRFSDEPPAPAASEEGEALTADPLPGAGVPVEAPSS